MCRPRAGKEDFDVFLIEVFLRESLLEAPTHIRDVRLLLRGCSLRCTGASGNVVCSATPHKDSMNLLVMLSHSGLVSLNRGKICRRRTIVHTQLNSSPIIHTIDHGSDFFVSAYNSYALGPVSQDVRNKTCNAQGYLVLIAFTNQPDLNDCKQCRHAPGLHTESIIAASARI